MNVKSKVMSAAIFRSLRPEFFVMIAIIIAMCWQLCLEVALSNDGALVLDEYGNFSVVHERGLSDQLIENGEALANFNPDTCRIIAVYDHNMQNIMRISFVDSTDILYDDSIYPDTVRSGSSREGTFDFDTPDGNTIRIVYKWYVAKNGNEFLTVYTSSIAREKMKAQRVAISYIVIILCFIMLATITYWQIHGITNRYRKLMLESMRYSIH